MTKNQIYMAQRILDNMSRLNKLKDEITVKYSNLDTQSTQEQVSEFLTFVIQSGFKGMIWPSIFAIIKTIDEDIEQLEADLKAL